MPTIRAQLTALLDKPEAAQRLRDCPDFESAVAFMSALARERGLDLDRATIVAAFQKGGPQELTDCDIDLVAGGFGGGIDADPPTTVEWYWLLGCVR